MCQHCGRRTDTTTVIGRQDPAGTVVEPGSQNAAETAALRATVGRIVRLMSEVIGGRRPAGQLSTLAAPSVLRYLRAARLTAPAGPLVLVSVRVCVPAEQVAELAAVVGYGERARALAARFGQGDDGWQCVTFRIL